MDASISLHLFTTTFVFWTTVLGMVFPLAWVKRIIFD